VWDDGVEVRTAVASGAWYFHVRGYNGDDVANGNLDLGPYNFDLTPPTAPSVQDEGVYTPSTSDLAATWSGAGDLESGIAQYQYAIGTSPGATDTLDWTITTGTSVTATGLTLDTEETYYFSVKAQNGAGLWGDPANSDGIKPVADTGTIAGAKGHEDGEPSGVVALTNKVVTASFGTHFYIEEYDTFSAIRVEGEGPTPGSTISVAGVMNTEDCERRITNATVKEGTGGSMPPARFMRQKNIGGEDFNAYTPGLPGKTGLHNVGLLIQAVGLVTHVESGVIYFDDGSKLNDGSGYTGLRVDIGALSPSKAAELVEDAYAVLSGIVTTESSLSDAPLLKLRDDGDVMAVHTSP